MVLDSVLAARTAFLGHDAGHRQIARSARGNRWLGLLLGDLLLGMGHGWWNDKHNRHHANPNHVGKDPDVGEGVLAWTSERAGRRRGVLRWVARHQAALFFPLPTLDNHLKVRGRASMPDRTPPPREGVVGVYDLAKRLKRRTCDRSMPSRIIWNWLADSSTLLASAGALGK